MNQYSVDEARNQKQNIAMLTAWLLCWTFVNAQAGSSSLLIAENASSGQFTFTDGVLEIPEGRGWLRTSRFYSDFSLSFEFRPLRADAQVAVVMRALVSQGQIFEPAYRISLPQLLSGDVRNAVRRPKNAITLVEEGRIQSAAPDAWQRLEVTARLNRITLTLSEVFVGTYHVDGFTGYLLLTSKKGVVQLRNVADRRSRLSNSRPALSSYYPMRRRTQYVKPTIEELHRNQ